MELLKKISDREVKLSPRDEHQVEKEDASSSEESFHPLSPTPPGHPIFSGTTLPRNTSVETTPSGVLRESSPPGPRPITTPPPPSADTMPELEDLEPPPISIDHSLSSGIRHSGWFGSGDQDELESIQEDDSEATRGPAFNPRRF